MSELEKKYHELLNQNYKPDEIAKALESMKKANGCTR